MAEGDVPCKKLKLDFVKKPNLSIFEQFLENKGLINKLQRTIGSFKAGYNDMNLYYRKIEETNARSCVSFSRSTCETTGILPGVAAGSIFHSGIWALRKFCEEPPSLPKNDKKSKALELLLKFLISDHKALTAHMEKAAEKGGQDDFDREGEWAVRLSQHFFSKLVDETPKLDSYKDYKDTLIKRICPCSEKDLIVGNVMEDISFGCQNGWHGSPDILMNIPIVIREEGEEENDGDKTDEFSSSSTIEVKKTQKFSEQDVQQILAQTIVFSFLKAKEANERKQPSKHNLVPGIGISSRTLFISYFDSENDVLLTTKPNLELFECVSKVPSPHFELVWEIVVLTWLTLNYKLFSSGLTDIKKISADFCQRVGDKIQSYRKEVTMPCHVHRKESDLDWAYYGPGLSMHEKEPQDEYVKMNDIAL